MKFKETLLQGSLIKRYKRFFIDIKHKNKSITAHCPNSGSMMGLLKKGNKVYFSKSDNPKRKLKYTAEIIKVKKILVGVNTHLSNKTIEDFYLMYNCKHYIVAPTSFHWWAAWLNQNPNKICLKPKNINSSDNIDFWPDSWISI